MSASVNDRIQRLADAARPSAERNGVSGSSVIELRFYVRDPSSSLGGKVVALDDRGHAIPGADLPLSDHRHAGDVVQEVLDRMRSARADDVRAEPR